MKPLPLTHYEFWYNRSKDSNGFFKSCFYPEMDIGEFIIKCCLNDKIRAAIEIHENRTIQAITSIFHIFKVHHFKKIFYINREVCKLLRNTNLNLDVQFLTSPFEEVLLCLDQNDLKLNDQTGTEPLKYIYISLMNEESIGKKMLRFVGTGPIAVGGPKDINVTSAIEIPEEGTLNDVCKINADSFKATFSETAPDQILETFKFIVNALIYIGCQNANLFDFFPKSENEALEKVKSSKKRAKIKRKFSNQTKCPIIYVGHNDSLNGEPQDDGKKLDHEVLVSGFWRVQWYGSRGNGTRHYKIIRIEPFVRGKGLKKVEPKRYMVN